MTLVNGTTINCGHCGKKIEIDLYKTVNVDVDPHLKERVLEGTINSALCVNCNTMNKVMDTFLYHDMELGLMAWVCPEQSKENADEIRKEKLKADREIREDTPKILTQGTATIVVFGINDLKEKLRKAGDLLRSELKLYSSDKYNMNLVATIYVDNGKLVIESSNQKVKEDLDREINKLIDGGGVFLLGHSFKNDDFFLKGYLVKVNHPYFLHALKNCSYLWQSNKMYGGYVIYGFNSCLFEMEENNIPDLESFVLGSSEKNPTTQKFDLKVYTNPHKDQNYTDYIRECAARLVFFHSLYSILTPREKYDWRELYFKAFNTGGRWIDDYAKRTPRVDFLESCLSYEKDERALQQCDSEKLSYLVKLRANCQTAGKEREKEIICLEKALNLKFPDSYKQFLMQFGGGYKKGKPISGKPNIFGLPAETDWGSALSATVLLREVRKDIPPDFVVIGFFDGDCFLCLDLREKPEKDAPLVKIHYKSGDKRIGSLHRVFSYYLRKAISKARA